MRSIDRHVERMPRLDLDRQGVEPRFETRRDRVVLASSTWRCALAERSWKAFDLAELVSKSEKRGTPYLEFLRVPQLSCGLYHLPSGAADTQSTHDEDEVYFVLKGRAHLVLEEEETTLSAGQIVYVPADTPHEFIHIEEDLSLLVFFGSGGPSGAEI